MIIKTKSLSSPQNQTQITNEGYVTQNNSSNHTQIISRKSSFKNKIISLFKSRSKQSQVTKYTAVDENTRNASKVDSSNSTVSFANILTEYVFTSQSQKQMEIKYNIEKLGMLDRQIIKLFILHPWTATIIATITEQPCSIIKLPSAWIMNIGPYLSNRALLPFLTTIPGILGLKNHGNTCYVNVIIQCLAHIDSMAKYFSTKNYLVDVHQNRPTNINVNLLVAFSYLIQSLWQHTYQPSISLRFCQLLTLYQTQFTIDSQQDAHELLLCLLNILHENLTRPVDNDHKTSFIYDTFRGSLTNEITCPHCNYSSQCHDQTLSLNLQIPNQTISDMHNSLFSIIVIDGYQVSVKHAFEIDKTTTVADIRAGIADHVGCNSRDIIILELIECGFGSLYSDRELIVNIAQKNNHLSSDIRDKFENGVFAVNIPNQVVDVDALQIDKASLDEIYNSVKGHKDPWNSQPFIRLLVVHAEKNQEYITEISDELRRTLNMDSENGNANILNKKHFRRFTNILTVLAARKTKLNLLRHSLGDQMCKYLNLRNVTKLPKPQFVIEGFHLISEFDNYPLSHPSITMALKHSSEIYGEESAVVRLVVVWPFRTTQILRFNSRISRSSMLDNPFMAVNFHNILLHESVEELIDKYGNSVSANSQDKTETRITITDCLRAFFGIGSLSITESWNCPNCATTERARTRIRIKEAPEILVLMLKRFTTAEKVVNRSESTAVHGKHPRKDSLFATGSSNKRSDNLNKLDCFIDYPLDNLDMRNYMEAASDSDSYMYNLVSVVNHRGSLSNGHYVAICQNSIDKCWRIYDDEKVSEMSKSDVVHRDAYILFYKRQSISRHLNSNLNVHWSYRQLPFPDKIHRNQSPNPIGLNTKTQSYSDIRKSKDIHASLPINVTNNHNKLDSFSPIIERSSTNYLLKKL